MSRNLHLNVAKAYRIRQGRPAATSLTASDQIAAALTSAFTQFASFAGGHHAYAQYVRSEEIWSEITALSPDIETLEAILNLVKHGVTPREMRLIPHLINPRKEN